MEQITIINKSGKVVKTSKHLFGIFKEAKAAYQEKKAEIKAEIHQQKQEKLARKHLEESQSLSVTSIRKHRERHLIEDDRSETSTSTRRTHRSQRSRRTRHYDDETIISEQTERTERRPKTALTSTNLETLSQASSSVAGSRYGDDNHTQARPSTSHRSGAPPSYYEDSYVSRPVGARRAHTDFPRNDESQYNPPARPICTVRPRSEFDPEPEQKGQLQRSATMPTALRSPSNNVDLNLAYGDIHPSHLPPLPPVPQEHQPGAELQVLTTRLETLMLEAQCVQHTATTIITSLQKNPDAMAAVALTLAEVSNLVAKAGPGILAALKTSSPAVFALLLSPQFLIAGGVAVGVTIVMFGGYKIIKKIQKDIGDKKEARALLDANGVPAGTGSQAETNTPEEALPFDPENYDNYSIDSWRRGVTGVDESEVDEYITPKADKLRREQIKARKREERERERSVAPDDSISSVGTRSRSMIRRKELPRYLDERDRETLVTGSARSERSERTHRGERTQRTDKGGKSLRSEASDASTIKPSKKGKEKDKEKKEKKPSTLALMFKGSSSVGKKKSEPVASNGIRAH